MTRNILRIGFLLKLLTTTPNHPAINTTISTSYFIITLLWLAMCWLWMMLILRKLGVWSRQHWNQKRFCPKHSCWTIEPIFISSTTQILYLQLLLALVNTSTSPDQRLYVIKWVRLCGALKSLPLPFSPSEYYFQPNSIINIISLSLLSGTHQIVMDIDVENTSYVFNREDWMYTKYTRCATTNLYTYVVGVGLESEVLLHSTVEGEGKKSPISTRLILKQYVNNRKCWLLQVTMIKQIQLKTTSLDPLLSQGGIS